MSLIKTVQLADPTHKVPHPTVPRALLPTEPFTVQAVDPFYAALLEDGTLVEAQPATPAPTKAEKPKS